MTEQEKEQALENKAKQACEIFNGYRLRFKDSRMSGSAISDLLSKMGFPKSQEFRKILVKYGVIIKDGERAHCVWSMCQNPIHFEKFKNIFKEWEGYVKTHYKKYSRKAIKPEQLLTEENAINLLKSLNYKIQKQIIRYEEV